MQSYFVINDASQLNDAVSRERYLLCALDAYKLTLVFPISVRLYIWRCNALMKFYESSVDNDNDDDDDSSRCRLLIFSYFYNKSSNDGNLWPRITASTEQMHILVFRFSLWWTMIKRIVFCWIRVFFSHWNSVFIEHKHTQTTEYQSVFDHSFLFVIYSIAIPIPIPIPIVINIHSIEAI